MHSLRGPRRAAGVLVPAILGLLALVATVAGSAVPAGAAAGNARNELLARLERGTRTTWAMTTRFHRDTPAGPLDARLEQLNRPPDWLTSGFGSVRGIWNGTTVDCANAPGGKLCGPGSAVDPAVGAGASVAALRKATGPHGETRVRRAGTVEAAGRRGRCWSLVPRGQSGPTRRSTEYCLTRDGIPLRVRVRRPDSTDTATAQTVRTAVTDADFERLLRGYPIGPRS